MALPNRLFYTLKELAEKWGKTENELVQWGAAKKLNFSMNFDGYLGEVQPVGRKGAFCLSRRFPLDAAIIRKIMIHGETPLYFVFSDHINHPIDPPCDTDEPLHRRGYKVTKSDLVVGIDIVFEMETKHPELLSSGGAREERPPENQAHEKVATQKKVKIPIRKPGVKNGLTVSLENARALLIGKNKKEPTCRQVIAYLTFDDPLGCVVDDCKDDKDYSLGWHDNLGKYHKTKEKTIANKLTKIRKENNMS